ncbi:hypothetical protein N9C82_01455 [bacterium]|nr:hypothetical protein [bacterium]
MILKHITAILKFVKLILRLNSKYDIYKQILNKRVTGPSGKPAPWYVFAATSQLENMDFNDKSVLEYGSGSSTLWWAGRCKSICSIENSKEWYNLVQKKISTENISYHLFEDKVAYCDSIDPLQFDVVVIDGRWREEIFKKILSQNSPVIPFIIIDNAERFPSDIASLKKLGYAEYIYYGFGPINTYEWQTSILVKNQIESVGS